MVVISSIRLEDGVVEIFDATVAHPQLFGGRKKR